MLIRYTAFLDANVLYSSHIRNLLIQLASTEVFRARWSEDVHREWMAALTRNRPDIHPDRMERTRRLMDRAVPDCLITGYKHLIDGLSLPDPDDRHVLAAALVGRFDVIVTWNRRDFPADIMKDYDLEVLTPDDFLHVHIDLVTGLMLDSVRIARQRLNNPAFTPKAYLAKLMELGLVKTAIALEEYESRI